MRLPLIVLGLLASGSLQICGSSEQPPGETRAAASAEAPASVQVALEAQIGGQIVSVGEHRVELALHRRGYAEALVYDAGGARIADPTSASVVVHANAVGGGKRDVALRHSAELARFAADGRAEAELAPGPVEVELTVGGGSAARGRLEAPVLLVGPELGGTLAVVGSHGVELVAGADGRLEALVHDAAGARVEGDADARLEVDVSGADGKLHACALTWNQARGRFTGRAEAAVKLAAGPAKLRLGADASARLPKLALRAEAAHAGRVVVVGDWSVELVALPGELVAAYVLDGAAHAKGQLELALRVGAGAFVKLAWDAPSLSYRAKLDAGLDLDAEPLVVSVKAQGKVAVGAHVPSPKLRASAGGNAKLAAKAQADAKAKAKANANANANAKASVGAPKVKVSAPKVSVSKSAGVGGKAKAGFSIGTK